VAQALVWGWKARKPYCDAILCYSTRIALDGSPSGETVDDEARAVAAEQLELRKRRREATPPVMEMRITRLRG
jgi:sRNA-binding protein